MNILIVDDETIIREWLQHTIQSLSLKNLSADSAADGIEALEMISRNSYDVIFIDIQMPKLNGMDLLKKIRETDKNMTAIILSSHDQFDYAREVMRYGAQEYILKSECNRHSLEILLRKCQDHINNMQTNASYYRSELLNIALNPLFHHTFTKADQREAFPELSKKFFFTVAMTLETPVEQITLPVDENSSISPVGIYIGQMNHTYYYIFLVLRPLDSLTFRQLLSDLLPKLCESYPTLKAGCSGIHKNIEHLELCLQEANTSLMQLFYETQAWFVSSPGINKDFQQDLTTLNTEVLNHIRNYNNKKILDTLFALNECIIESRPNDINLVKDTYTSFVNSTYLYYYKDTSSLLPLLNHMKEQIHRIESFYHLKDYVDSIIRQCLLFIPFKQKYCPHVESALIYIVEHYARITAIGEIASHVHLNSDYLARLFKKETGENITSFLMEYKLNIAALMLKSTNNQVSDIALNVGIPNISYFSKKFKEQYGMQPAVYRTINRQKTEIDY